MNTAKFGALVAVCLGMAAFLSSCGSGAKRVDAMVGDDGKVSGVIIEYSSEIDVKSIDKGTYQVPGYVVHSFFASNSNPFRKEKEDDVKDPSVKGNGHNVVVFLKPDPNRSVSADKDQPVELSLGKLPDIDVRVKQVAPVRTAGGKTLKPWKESVKAKELYPV